MNKIKLDKKLVLRCVSHDPNPKAYKQAVCELADAFRANGDEDLARWIETQVARYKQDTFEPQEVDNEN